LTTGQFWFRIVFYILCMVFWGAALVFSKHYTGLERVFPAVWILLATYRLWEVIHKWRQQNQNKLQSSEAET
jgi:hypothetical protein